MTLSDFQDAIDRHGDQISCWPLSIRSEALALLASSPEARAALAESRLMTAAIRASAPLAAPPGLSARIFAAAGLAEREARSAAPLSATR